MSCGPMPSKTAASDISGIHGVSLLIAFSSFCIRRPVGTVLHNQSLLEQSEEDGAEAAQARLGDVLVSLLL